MNADGVDDATVTPDPDLAHRDGRADDATVGARGMRALTQEEFSALDALGGVRGVVESVVPGLLFVVVYLAAGQRLAPALIASAGAAVLAVLVRLVQRTPPTQAFSGVLGVGIGVLWAWRTGEAEDYFLYGLLVNAGYLAGTLVSVLVGWPLVGLVMGLFDKAGPLAGGSWPAAVAWRQDRSLRRRYTLATWPWVALFGLRLLVQVPFYLGGEVAWLGTAKLAMGVPLTAVALWLSWMLVRGSGAARAPSRPRRDP
ncbi:DUF3159 domain-containing protein [Cellulomonas soli]|uniref:DUF3159 domain-containing protein n=1 Tax=Cellulomonas soli TaxID=931535 RepID=A0A512P9V1_9CELL|nr:DUF3159 domain-containing protein [Cellulomonas soli]NYI60468.1 hypothetical protein [Cellulomonas soli]GEP67983.1 hypothetical protein CSO01_06980 [Cellulomonas soli]